MMMICIDLDKGNVERIFFNDCDGKYQYIYVDFYGCVLLLCYFKFFKVRNVILICFCVDIWYMVFGINFGNFIYVGNKI